MPYRSERFGAHHQTEQFDSGQAVLDDWLRRSARDSDGRNLTRTYVWHDGDDIAIAYYSLTPFVIERAELTHSQGRGLPDRIPGYLLARLALDRRHQGQGLGTQVLASALERAARGSISLGGRYVVVDAIDDRAAAFYAHHGFQPIPGVADRLILPVKVIPLES